MSMIPQTDRLTPEREAEITARAAAATPGPWEEHEKYGRHFFAYLGGPYLRGVGTLNFGEGDDAGADRALTVNAQADITALLAELAAVRAERDQAQADLAGYEPLNPQQCPAGKHADWLVDSEHTHACPWCRIAELEENLRAVNAGWGAARARVAELERPAVEAKRNEIRSSFGSTIAQAQEDRDHEGAFALECQLREREEQWKREDEAVTR